jgi:hypothetical protein
MNRERKRRYRALRNIRRERDYEIGRIQYANRPYTRPAILPPGAGVRKALTTRKFMGEATR